MSAAPFRRAAERLERQRQSIRFRLAINVAALWVFGRSFLHARSCAIRLERACRLYAAGNIKEGDRAMAAIQRSRAAFQRRHPHWQMALAGGAH